MKKVIYDLNEWKSIRKEISSEKTAGFVPTLGNLHAGHGSLLQRSKKENEISILSVFVNPTQFNNPEDFKNYPRTLDQDIEFANQNEVDYILIPSYEQLYSDNYQYKICNEKSEAGLEGAYRPGHFEGVLTVVLKLLLLVKPTRAYFGEKDYEQLRLVKNLVSAFHLDMEVVGCPTIRNEFGLPLSSRNSRLTLEEYNQAQHFPKIFHSSLPCNEIKAQLINKGFQVDYIQEENGRRFAAVKLGNVRLIDNIIFSEE